MTADQYGRGLSKLSIFYCLETISLANFELNCKKMSNLNPGGKKSLVTPLYKKVI